jgi:hypothetical protein
MLNFGVFPIGVDKIKKAKATLTSPLQLLDIGKSLD